LITGYGNILNTPPDQLSSRYFMFIIIFNLEKPCGKKHRYALIYQDKTPYKTQWENIGENTMIIMCMSLKYHLLENPCGKK
jgi:hypothetical protein